MRKTKVNLFVPTGNVGTRKAVAIISSVKKIAVDEIRKNLTSFFVTSESTTGLQIDQEYLKLKKGQKKVIDITDQTLLLVSHIQRPLELKSIEIYHPQAIIHKLISIIQRIVPIKFFSTTMKIHFNYIGD